VQVVILAGGLGTRLSEETSVIPKPMVKIGDMPILVHIMNHYASYGHSDFIIALGYRGYLIKEYFLNYKTHTSDIEVNLGTGEIDFLSTKSPLWKIRLIDTGELSPTGERLRLLEPHLNDDFFLTYGDGLSNVNLDKLLAFHLTHSGLVTVSAVKPPPRFGTMEIKKEGQVVDFSEKSASKEGWINGGYFVMRKNIMDFIKQGESLEDGALTRIAPKGLLKAYLHQEFWHPMDTLRDKNYLNELWRTDQPPWKVLPRE
jgi:glucose-1-phosphate cytidylyltransferase